MKLAIIGCGLIGNKRAQAASAAGLELVAACDSIYAKAEELCALYGGKAFVDPKDVFLSDADIVNIAVTHDRLAQLALSALEAGKHLLLEKPGARNPLELAKVAELARQRGLKVKVGYNHRFHPSFIKAKELKDSGALGPLMYIRGRYGHGGRLGYEKEWRMVKETSGGGELLDQGSHLIDLALWFLGDVSRVSGYLPNYYWKAEVEDNAFMILESQGGQCAFLHASWTEWKNMFSFEIAGRDAKLAIDGLGGSYGTEQLSYFKMLPSMGPPETTIWQYPFPDKSWQLELSELVSAIKENRNPVGGVDEALEILKITEQLYMQQKFTQRGSTHNDHN
ncbi:MAG: Gfo/Idh/MocA family oxidoreductase [Deltaproteobacteria bacterium]|jgi:predicted dehydrogenase|nr:Gfo/Idh/MocA family oxidoreductase [Deltaproteobacteria bacterium]